MRRCIAVMAKQYLLAFSLLRDSGISLWMHSADFLHLACSAVLHLHAKGRVVEDTGMRVLEVERKVGPQGVL